MDNLINQKPEVIKHLLIDDGTFPNSNLFLLIYKDAFLIHDKSAAFIEETFRSNNWKNSWRNGIFDYNHYHSTTHEVLGVCNGIATVLLGGDKGVIADLRKGDVVIIPAGVAHKCLKSSEGFQCVGAYPDGKNYDIKKGHTDERPGADNNIKLVPLPEMDPVYGSGPLQLNWELQ